jgi:uncharacterized membrane protein YgcG
MGDPFVIACIALGLSVVASAVRIVDWFLHADPRAAAQVTRWGARGIAALSVPLLAVLLLKEQWTAATALAAAMVLVAALLGRRLWGWVGAPSLAGYGVPADACSANASSFGASGPSFVDEAELVRYSAAVLEAYLRRTAAAQSALGSDLPAIADLTRQDGSANGKSTAVGKGSGSEANGSGKAKGSGEANGGSHSTDGGVSGEGGAGANGHGETFGLGAMSEEEASAVLGVDRGATETEILAAHDRISTSVDPAHGGSPYLAIKVDQAKEVLVRAAASAKAPPKALRKRSAARRRPSPPA